ncbi:hypothetical protein BpHYR1_051072 [Brachionus plicatilis]|uniref:Uncharacterized protein n=1 Tax=Brachionus plicatilis TaxID=10195 RepID=A0A3M7QW80_BRAPC|nr:hypothetical protein BpHYR1_051072 [Brachionus plicatilis]
MLLFHFSDFTCKKNENFMYKLFTKYAEFFQNLNYLFKKYLGMMSIENKIYNYMLTKLLRNFFYLIPRKKKLIYF